MRPPRRQRRQRPTIQPPRWPWPQVALVLAAASLGATLFPAPAAAWTDARVTRASAQVEMDPEGRFFVSLDVGLRVRGGWLSSFQLEGLGERVVFDAERPPSFESADGRRYSPKVSTSASGEVVMAFPSRRRAPRRGHYRVVLHYETGSAAPPAALPSPGQSGDRLQLAFGFPAWRVGLERVDIELTGPAGLELLTPAGPGVEVEVSEAAGRTLLRLSRAHLPRGVPWQLELAVPRAWASPALWPRAAPTLRAITAPADHRPALWWSLLLVFLCVAKQGTLAATGSRGRFVVPLPSRWLRGLATLALGAVAAIAPLGPWTAAPLAAAVLLCVVRPTRTPRRVDLRFAPISPLGLSVARQQRWVGWGSGGAWLDLTRPAGWLLCGALWWLAIAAPHPTGLPWFPWVVAVLSTTLCLTGCARHVEAGTHAAMLTLAARLPALRRAGLDAHLVAGLEPRGRVADVRLALTPSASVPGLIRIDCVQQEVAWFEQTRSCWLLLVEVAEGSLASQAAHRLLPNAHVRTADGRLQRSGAHSVLAAPCRDMVAEAAHVVDALTKEAAARQSPDVPAPEASVTTRSAA